MEAIVITAVTVCGSIVTSIISLVIERKIRKKKQKKENAKKSIDLANHEIFSAIDQIIKNELSYFDFGGVEYVRKFLQKRLQITKKNLLELLRYDLPNASPEKCKRLINAFINGLNGFNDIGLLSNYDNIDEHFLDNFNKLNYHSTLILLNYMEIVNVEDNLVLLDDFFNLYVSFLKSLCNYVCFNIDFLIGVNVVSPDAIKAHNEVMIKKQLHYTMNNIEMDSTLCEYIENACQKKKYLNRANFFIYFNDVCEIVYCSENGLKSLGYPIHHVIGSSFLALCHHNYVPNFEHYLENKQIHSIKLDMLNKNETVIPILVYKYSELIHLCFML